jgi:hypothetical protein
LAACAISVSLSAYYAFPALSAWLPVQSLFLFLPTLLSLLYLFCCLYNLLFLFLPTTLSLLCLLGCLDVHSSVSLSVYYALPAMSAYSVWTMKAYLCLSLAKDLA